MTAAPQIPGYELGQRLLRHPLAEIWRGRSFTGLDIVALVLSEAGARDQEVRGRLDHASRDAALAPGQQETPLWAANLAAARPYAITRLVPGQSGAERLLDPLDGVLGNDTESLDAVRNQLAQFGAAPPPPAELPWLGQPAPGTYAQPVEPGPASSSQAAPTAAAPPTGRIGLTAEHLQRIGRWVYPVIAVAVLIVFSVTYSIGGAIGSVVKDPPPAVTQAPIPTVVSPGALPSPALKPGIVKAATAPYRPTAPAVSLVGATYHRGADVQVVEHIGLPFAFGWPRPPSATDLGESSYAIYRRVQTGRSQSTAALQAQLAVHPCRDLADCLADRSEFDRQWTTYFKADAPRTAKDGQTWVRVRPAGSKPYALTMTHAFSSGGRWWLAGVMVTGARGEESAMQRVLNDIRSQTP
ncbi:MAG TPA: hypothetical protein VFT31_01615 [Kribbella sp.]|nr:hypothetical protein [Kribbella sp.]